MELIPVIPETMRAFVLTGHGDMDKLVYHTDWPVPQISDTEVLIKVHACGLNNTDVNTRTAWYSKGVEENTTMQDGAAPPFISPAFKAQMLSAQLLLWVRTQIKA